jgi:hypothetical protein
MAPEEPPVSTTETPRPVIAGPDEAVASVALRPLVEADRAVEAALTRRAQTYAAARDAGWRFGAIQKITGHSRGWVHTLVQRGRAEEDR